MGRQLLAAALFLSMCPVPAIAQTPPPAAPQVPTAPAPMVQKLFRADSKVGFLSRLLARLQEPVIVFTEYRDTLLDLRERLGRDAAVIHGGLSRAERPSGPAQVRRPCPLPATDRAGVPHHQATRPSNGP